mmetsp:Transcript_95284/g.308618  ORF Transcript_95284/g.308618 Transcript_95284/m.308618 type:complete len:518 (+) Transcript_95284:868-2421(+)
MDLGSPIQSRRNPAACARFLGLPRVCDGLVPAARERKATVVVVPQHAQPLHPIKAGSAVNFLEDRAPLTGPRALRPQPRTTQCLHAAPIEVVADIENVVGTTRRSSGGHLPRHPQLRRVVDPHDEGPLLLREEVAPVVRGFRRLPLLVHDAAPIADDEHVVWALRSVQAHRRQLQAVVVRRLHRLGRHNEALVATAAGLRPRRRCHGRYLRHVGGGRGGQRETRDDAHVLTFPSASPGVVHVQAPISAHRGHRQPGRGPCFLGALEGHGVAPWAEEAPRELQPKPPRALPRLANSALHTHRRHAHRASEVQDEPLVANVMPSRSPPPAAQQIRGPLRGRRAPVVISDGRRPQADIIAATPGPGRVVLQPTRCRLPDGHVPHGTSGGQLPLAGGHLPVHLAIHANSVHVAPRDRERRDARIQGDGAAPLVGGAQGAERLEVNFVVQAHTEERVAGDGDALHPGASAERPGPRARRRHVAQALPVYPAVCAHLVDRVCRIPTKSDPFHVPCGGHSPLCF